VALRKRSFHVHCHKSRYKLQGEPPDSFFYSHKKNDKSELEEGPLKKSEEEVAQRIQEAERLQHVWGEGGGVCQIWLDNMLFLCEMLFCDKYFRVLVFFMLCYMAYN